MYISARLCLFSNHVLSLSIAFYNGLFLLILQPLSSKLLFLVCHVASLVNQTRSILFAHCAFNVALHHHAFQRTYCPLLLRSIFSPVLAFVWLLWVENISFPLASNTRCSSSFFLDLHQTTQSWHQRYFRIVAEKNEIEKGEGGREKRGRRRKETQIWFTFLVYWV